MKILYVTCIPAEATQYGGAMRDQGIIRGLRQKHEVKLLQTGYTRRSDRQTLLELEQRFKPDRVWYFQKYAVRATGFPQGTPAIIDFDNMPWRQMLLTSKYTSWPHKPAALLKTLASYVEDNLFARRAAVIATAKPERRLPLGRLPAMIIPNGFDFSKSGAAPSAIRQARIVFWGLLSYYPNLEGINWFCTSIWPRIAAAAPNAQLEIIGSYDQKPGVPDRAINIQLRGFVENLDEAIRDSAMLIVPLRIGSGTRIKILEAWAKGLPVVSTRLGCEGLRAEHGQTALMADSAEDFAQVCLSLLAKPELGAELAVKALQHGRKYFDWQKIYPLLDDVLAQATASHGPKYSKASA